MEKHLYRLWIALFTITLGIAIIFTTIALKGVWKYFSLSETVTATTVQWSVLEVSSSRFALKGNYRYTVNGISYTGKSILAAPRFLNRYAAENQEKCWRSTEWKVWYQKQNPRISSLERAFPSKQVMHAVLTLGVLGYFYFSRGLFYSCRYR